MLPLSITKFMKHLDRCKAVMVRYGNLTIFYRPVSMAVCAVVVDVGDYSQRYIVVGR